MSESKFLSGKLYKLRPGIAAIEESEDRVMFVEVDLPTSKKKSNNTDRLDVSIYEYEGDTMLEIKDVINKGIQRFNLKSELELLDIRKAIDEYLEHGGKHE